MHRWITILAIAAVAAKTPVDDDGFALRIIHTNDMHARFEQISQFGGKCTDSEAQRNLCYGGFPRLLTAVKQQRRQAKEEGVPLLFLNAGDTYQGTAWYSIHKWKVVAALSNLLTIDAESLGNHEFDDGVEGLVPFLKEVKFPVVTCNLGLQDEPDLAKTDLLPSLTFNLSGHRVGVIGYLTPETTMLSETGRVHIYDEIGNLTTEAQRMKDDGVEIIIAVGHSGFDTDLRIAKAVPHVDAVIGGHTNTFLYTGKPPDIEIPSGPYPQMVTQPSGRKVAVVQAFAYTKYLGVLNLKFDSKGELIEATGNPKLLNSEVEEDPTMLEALEPWREAVQNLTMKKLGTLKVFLDGQCRFFECNFGNLVADAFIDYAVSNHVGQGWTFAPIAIQQGGGIRTSIDASEKKGIVTLEDVITALPFYNPLEVISLEGKYLLEALEWSVARYDPHHHIGRGEFLQVSGLQVTYDLTQPPGQRVVKALARCGNCSIPRLSPVSKTDWYNMIMPTFLAQGGDNYSMFIEHGKKLNRAELTKLDTDIVADFILERKVIFSDVQERITFMDYSVDDDRGNSAHVSKPFAFLSLTIAFFVCRMTL